MSKHKPHNTGPNQGASQENDQENGQENDQGNDLENNQAQDPQANKWQDVEDRPVEDDLPEMTEDDLPEDQPADHPEDQSAADEAAGEPIESSALQAEVDALKLKNKEVKDDLLRLHAEMDNLRRRSERDVASAHKYGSEKLIKDLLPVIESLRRALEGAEKDSQDFQGIQLTLDMLLKTMEKNGVMMIDPAVGETFNPERHDAMSMQQDPNADPNTILAVLEAGYELNGRVLKAAMVVVNQA